VASIEDRVSALEAQMVEVRTLAAGAHEDTGELKAAQRNHLKVLNGWGTQLNGRLDRMQAEIDLKFDQMEARFGQELALVNQGFRQIEERFATLGTAMAHITALLERLSPPEPEDDSPS
jgi:hypothetical protein